MALSLYRKYRPQTFEDVVGQEHIEQTLKNAVITGSVSQAYLFCGPRGTGKTTTARLLAKALLCEKSPTSEPDGSCPQCVEIADGIHPDVYELDAASRTGVENVREEIIGRVQFAPTRGSHKIYIIDEVHMLSTAAFNALLKTLEEPPKHIVFILCTTDPHKVPQTIISRCQRFDFHRLSEQQITQQLQAISDAEGFEAEPEALGLIAQRSQGGMRDAINALEQVAVFGGGRISHAAAEDMLGEVSDSQLFGIGDLMARRDIVGCFEWVAAFSQTGTDIAQFVRDLTAHIRNLYVVSVAGSGDLTEILDADAEKTARYRDQASTFGSSDRLAHMLLVLGDLTTELRAAANSRLSLEIALTRMVRPQSDLSLQALAARLDALEQGEGSSVVHRSSGGASAQTYSTSDLSEERLPQADPGLRNSHPTSTAKADDAASAEKDDGLLGESQPSEADTSTAETDLTDLANVRHLWAQVEKEVKARRRGLATMFGGSRAHVDSLSGGLLIELPTTANFAKNTLERPESQEYVRDAVKQVFGQNLKLTYVLGAPDGVSEEAKPASTAAPAAAPAVIAPSVDIYDDATAATTAPGEPTIVGNDTNIVGFSDSASTASFNDGSAAAPTGSSDTAASVSFSDGTTVAPTGSGDTIVAPAGDGSISFEEMLAASFGTSITVEELPSNKGDI